jgi:hypothetical protein
MSVPGIQEIQALALKYSKPQLASMAQSGLIDTQKAVLAAMMRDRISKEDAKPPTSTVVQDALGLQPPRMAQPQGMPQQPQQMAQAALQARPQMGAPAAPVPETPVEMAATGGLTSIPIKSEDYAGGGIVAFAKGGTPYQIYEAAPKLLSVAPESTFEIEKQRQLDMQRAFGIDPEFYKKREEEVGLEREKLTKEKSNSLADALIAGGLGVAAGSSPYALQNIATGATKGFETYQGQMKDIRERDKALIESQNRIKEAAYLRSIGQGEAADKYIQESKRLAREGANENIKIENKAAEEIAKSKTEASKTQFTEGQQTGRTAMQVRAQKEIAQLPGSEQKLLDAVYEQEKAKNPEITKLEVYNKMHPTGQGTPYARAQMALQYDKEWNDMQENPVALRTFQKQNPTIKTSDDYVKHKMQQLDMYMTKTQGTPTPTQLTPEDQQALAWANANPSDPRAAQIKTRLGR